MKKCWDCIKGYVESILDVYPGCIKDYIEAYQEMWGEENSYGENC